MALSAEIIAKLGLDSAAFQQGLKASDVSLTAFEQRLQKFGVNFNPGAKIARESAKVFEEVAKAEAKLAAAKEDSSLRAAAGYNAEKILQLEISALKQRIDGIQGQTIAKVEAQILLEQKQLQLSQLNAVTIAKNNAAQSAAVAQLASAEGKLAAVQADRALKVSAGHNQEIVLQREILQLKGAIDRMQGQTIAKVEAQIMLEQKLLQLEQAIAAQSSRGAAGASFSSIARTAGEAQVKASGLGSAMGRLVSVSGVLKGAFTSLVGIGSALFAPAIADRLARLITGFSEASEKALEKLVEDTGKAADKQEKLLAEAKDRAARDAEERSRREADQADLVMRARIEAQEKAEDEARRKKEEEDQRALEIEEDLWERRKRAVEENREMMLLQAKAASGLTEEENKRLKVLELQAKQKGIQLETDTILLKGVKNLTPEDRARLATLTKQTQQIDAQVAGLQLANEKIAAATPLIESNIAAWQKFQMEITTTGRGDRSLSDRELERKANQLKQDIFSRTSNPLRAGQSDLLLEAQRGNLSQLLSEQNFRRSVRTSVAAFGEDAAFNQFPGLTEQRFREIIQGIDTSTSGRLATAVEKLSQRLDQPLLAARRPSPFAPGG